MKKILLSMLGVLMSLPTFARDFTYEYEGQTLIYTVLDEDTKICQTRSGSEYNDPGNPDVSAALIIPSVVSDGENDYAVIAIGEFGFIGGSLSEVTLPESLTHIGKYAFSDCKSLTSVEIPASVISIGDFAFYACNMLTTVTIPEGVTTIGDFAFSLCI